MSDPEPHFHPISALPRIASHIDGWLKECLETHRVLVDAPAYTLDDATVQRIVRVYGDHKDDLALFEEQLRRWRASALTVVQREQVERLTTQLARIRAAVDAVLDLAEELRRKTIEALLRKSDLEVGMELVSEMFTDKPKPPSA